MRHHSLKPLALIAVALLALCVIGGAMTLASDDSEAKTCPTCGGSGKITCPSCGGSGEIIHGNLGGSEYGEGCTRCGGSGEFDGSVTSSDYKCGSGTITCSTCSGSGTVADPHTHSYKLYSTSYGKCSGSVSTYKCSCGDSYTSGTKYDTHNYVSQGTVHGDCSGSKTTYKCSRCGDTYSSGTIYNSHSWGSWSITKAATCTESGTQTHKCTRCSDTETATIPATGHSWQIDGYTWSSDLSKCTVGYKCSKDSSHKGSETVNSTSTTDGNTKTYSISGKSSAYGISYSATKTVYTSILNFNANGGTGAPSAITYTGTATSAHTFTIPSTTPSRSGFIFKGWSENSSATAASYQPGSTISVAYNGTKTLYAVWQVANLDITSEPATKSLKVGMSWSYTPTVNVSGCTVTVSGADWLTVSDGKISGTPTTAGTYNITVTVSKTGYNSDSQTFSLKVYSTLGFNSVPGASGMFAFAE